jgi:hypothetical protein
MNDERVLCTQTPPGAGKLFPESDALNEGCIHTRLARGIAGLSFRRYVGESMKKYFGLPSNMTALAKKN